MLILSDFWGYQHILNVIDPKLDFIMVEIGVCWSTSIELDVTLCLMRFLLKKSGIEDFSIEFQYFL